MRDLFFNELRRFRGWALGFGATHLALLAFTARMFDLTQQGRFAYQLFAIVYLVSGTLLGLYQMGSYRRPNAWVQLLHRPLAPWRIALALFGAGALLLVLAIGLPLLVVAAWQHALTPRFLDVRHAWLAVSALLVALCGYGVGGYALLVPRRRAIAGLAALLLLAFGHASGFGAIVVQLAVLTWLAGLIAVAFRPDASEPPRGAAATAITALPLQLSLAFALLLSGFAIELGWIAQGTHPNNVAVPPPGSVKQADNADPRDLMLAGLANSKAPDAPLWREQAKLSDLVSTGPLATDLPARGELTNPAPLEFADPVRRVNWVFSHDRMRFLGVRLADDRPAGTLDVAGGFATPPLPIGNGLLVSRDAVYQFDEDSGTLLRRVRVPRGESLAGVELFGERAALLTDRALYFHDARELRSGDGVLAPRQRTPLPGAVGNLTRIDLMELVDGYLVSFTFTRGAHNGEGSPYQQIVRVGSDGSTTTVAARALDSHFGVLYRYQAWIASPVLSAVQRTALGAFAVYSAQYDVAPPPVPRAAWILAGVLALLSLAGAVAWMRRTSLRRSARWAWLATCALLGVPALLSLVLLVPPRDRLDDESGAASAPA